MSLWSHDELQQSLYYWLQCYNWVIVCMSASLELSSLTMLSLYQMCFKKEKEREIRCPDSPSFSITPPRLPCFSSFSFHQISTNPVFSAPPCSYTHCYAREILVEVPLCRPWKKGQKKRKKKKKKKEKTKKRKWRRRNIALWDKTRSF